MPTRHRKSRKMRGSRTHGWGVSGQHRDSGMQGGRGNAGGFKHKRSKLAAEGIAPGKHGFVNHSAREIRTVNLRDLSHLTPERPKDKSEDTLPLVDLSKLGYDKLLGEGSLEEPIAVRVAKASKSAAKKMKEMGGKILPTK